MAFFPGADVMWALNMTVQDEGYADVYDPTVDPSVANHFASAVFRFAHTLLPVRLPIMVYSTYSYRPKTLTTSKFKQYSVLRQSIKSLKTSAIQIESGCRVSRKMTTATHAEICSLLSSTLFFILWRTGRCCLTVPCQFDVHYCWFSSNFTD